MPMQLLLYAYAASALCLCSLCSMPMQPLLYAYAASALCLCSLCSIPIQPPIQPLQPVYACLYSLCSMLIQPLCRSCYRPSASRASKASKLSTSALVCTSKASKLRDFVSEDLAAVAPEEASLEPASPSCGSVEVEVEAVGAVGGLGGAARGERTPKLVVLKYCKISNQWY
jgi:hypothetical protein